MFSKNKILILYRFFILWGVGTFSAWAYSDWRVEQITYSKGKTEILHVEKIDKKITEGKRIIRSLPYLLDESSESTLTKEFEEIYYSDEFLPATAKEFFRLKLYENINNLDPLWKDSEVRTLAEQGPSQNRINLTILGDGYTLFEKEQFFQDAQRMTDDLFMGTTFASYISLFNVYAVFVPSQDSGITDTVKRNTAFGLYRSPANSKRAILPGSTRALEQALLLAPAKADYPIVIANDNFYGGLGGRYAITTRSDESGAIVLRHELGHNFGNVGEEYDGGQVYRGANHSNTKNVSWAHWLDSPLEVYHSLFLSGAYVWESLKNTPLNVKFTLPASAATSRIFVKLSTVGWSSREDVSVFINGSEQSYTGRFTEDRSFFDLHPDQSLAPGAHTLQIRNNKNDQKERVLAFALVYALPEGYDETENKIAAFQSFYSPGRPSGYRPTHQSCLMREMTLKHFCTVDIENMWHRFLAKVDLIDEVVIKNENIELKTPPLNGLEIFWYQKNSSGQKMELTHLRNKKQWNNKNALTGVFEVEVKFRTVEVRKYSPRFDSKKEFKI